MTSQAGLSAIVLAFALGLTSCDEHRTGTRPSAPKSSVVDSDRGADNGAVSSDASGPVRGNVRPAAFAGSWYPDTRALVVEEVQRWLRTASQAPLPPSRPLALVVPHAGWRFSAAAAAAAYRSLKPGDFERVVLVGPLHSGGLDGFAVSQFDAYATPLGQVPVCAATAQLADGDLVKGAGRVDAREHSLEIQLPFLQQTLQSFCLVPIVVGRTTPAMEAAMAEKLAGLRDGKTLFVFSSDFVHYGPGYGYTPFGPSVTEGRRRIDELEQRAISLLRREDPASFRSFLDETGATICGRRGLSTMLHLLPRLAKKSRAVVLSHYGSPDLPEASGDDGVWYVSMAYVADGKEEAQSAKPMPAPRSPAVATPGAKAVPSEVGQHLVRVARAAVDTQLNGTDALRQALIVLPSSAVLDRRQAAFVTFTENGELRGCVGQLEPEYPLTEATVRAALSAAFEDTRFRPVTRSELPALQVEVTVLEPRRPVASWRAIELGRHGIVLERGRRRALFLPQVPTEQRWTLPQTLDALSRKAGLPSDAWKGDDVRFYVFGGQVFHEAPDSAAAEREPSAGGRPEAAHP